MSAVRTSPIYTLRLRRSMGKALQCSVVLAWASFRASLPVRRAAQPAILMPPTPASASMATALLRPPFCCPLDVCPASISAPPCLTPACQHCRRRAALKGACQHKCSACMLRCCFAVRPVVAFMCLCESGPSQCKDADCVRVLFACAMCPPACP